MLILYLPFLLVSVGKRTKNKDILVHYRPTIIQCGPNKSENTARYDCVIIIDLFEILYNFSIFFYSAFKQYNGYG